MSENIKWCRSDDGNVATRCGRYEIEAVYMGRTKPQAFRIYAVAPDGSRIAIGYEYTQRAAKNAAYWHEAKTVRMNPLPGDAR